MTPQVKQRIEQIRRGEVPEGYKKTTVGIIPEAWNQVHIRDVCAINPLRSKKPEDKVTFLGMADVSEDGRLISPNIVEYCTVCKGFTPFERGDILVAKITPCFENGKGADTGTLPTPQGYGSTEFHVLRSKKVNKRYLFLHTTSYEFRKKLESEMSGSAGQKRVQAESIASYLLGLPSDEEQQRIANIIAKQDRIIELKEKLLEEKKQQKKALMQQLLTGRKRLPGFDGEWDNVKLGDVFEERVEKNCQDLELLSVTGTNGVVPRSTIEAKDNSSEDKSKYLKICKGDIGYNTMRMWQGVSALSDYEGIVSPAYTILKPSKSISAKYFSYLFKMHEVIFLFYRFSQGIVDDTRSLKYHEFAKLHLWVPKDKREQEAIAEILSTADREIELLEKELEQEKQKKKALMQLLLTGIVRV